MQSTRPPHSAIWRTAEFAIGGNLIEWLTDQRDCGASYQFMAGQLAQRGVMVSHETVRSWCQRVEISPASGPSQTAAGVGASPLAANPDAGDLS